MRFNEKSYNVRYPILKFLIFVSVSLWFCLIPNFALVFSGFDSRLSGLALLSNPHHVFLMPSHSHRCVCRRTSLPNNVF